MEKSLLAVLAAATLAQGAIAGQKKLYLDEYRDKMAGGWIGQTVGVAFGEPTEFKKQGTRWEIKDLPKWKPEMFNATFHQDDLYVEMTFMDTLLKRGIDVGVREAGIDFANSSYRLWCANENGRANLRRGIAAPSSSHPKNHHTVDDIDYQIESDFSGILTPGMPARAVKLGEQFGRIMNYGDGLYAGQFVGSMYSIAFFENDRVETVKKALKSIPAESRYAGMVRDVLGWYAEDPVDWQKAWELINNKYGGRGGGAKQRGPNTGLVSWPGIDVKCNGAMVLLGYLWGDGDIMRTVQIATAGGYDSDCNPSSALGVLGVQLGAKAFGPEYTGKINKKAKWEHTDFTWDGLMAASEKLSRLFVVAEGGEIGKDEQGEYFVINVREPEVGALEDSRNPGPDGDDRLTDEEMASIRYLPTPGQGSFRKENKFKIANGGKCAIKIFYRAHGCRTFDISIDGGTPRKVEAFASRGNTRTVDIPVELAPGEHVFRISMKPEEELWFERYEIAQPE